MVSVNPSSWLYLELVSEDFIITHTDWVFKIDRDLGLECLKKFNKEEPLKSDKILRHIKDNGGPKACIKYLEYLTLECGIAERPIHTELACLYVQYINSILHKNYLVEEGKDAEGNPLFRIDVEQADNDENIFCKWLLEITCDSVEEKIVAFLWE